MAVKLPVTVLLAVSLMFLLSCSSGPPSDDDRTELVLKACSVLKEAGYWYDNLVGMLSNGLIRGEVNENIMGMAGTITNAYPDVYSTAGFCVSARLLE